MTRRTLVAFTVALACSACGGTRTDPPLDSAHESDLDAGASGLDAGANGATVDAHVPSDGSSCNLGPPLATPIPRCNPALLPSTGDPHEDCVRRINQLRCECQHLPPLQRWVEGEDCADKMAKYDYDHGAIHAGFGLAICEPVGYSQNECPMWPTVESTISTCLLGMWKEGPRDGPTHYEAMASTNYTRVACGFFSGPAPATPPIFGGPVYAVQNFQ